MSPQPASARARAWPLMLAVLALLAVIGFASTSSMGPLAQVLPKAPRTQEQVTPPPIERSEGPQGSQSPRPELPKPKPMPNWIGDIIKAAAVMAVAVIIGVLIWRVAQALDKRFRDRAKAASAEAQEIPDIEDAEVVESLEQSITALRAGVDVDSAIVDCWRRLEQIAEASGIERRASQTAEEFTLAILSNTAANPKDLNELADLYRAAMFSTHTFGADHRDRAIGCLERLSEALSARTDG